MVLLFWADGKCQMTHMLVLNRADAVIVDPAGGEHSFADKGELADDIDLSADRKISERRIVLLI